MKKTENVIIMREMRENKQKKMERERNRMKKYTEIWKEGNRKYKAKKKFEEMTRKNEKKNKIKNVKGNVTQEQSKEKIG